MIKNPILPVLFWLSMVLSVCAAEKYYAVRVSLPKDPAARNSLLSLLEADHYQEMNGSAILTLTEKQLARLKQVTDKLKIVSSDALREYETENRNYFYKQKFQNLNDRVALEQTDQVLNNIIQTPAAFQVKPTLGGYYSFAEMESAMNTLVAAYPSIAQKFSIGNSVEGRPLWCIKISDNATTDESGEPELLYTGLVHAREAISGSSMIFLMQYLCENYATNTRIRNLVDNREFFILPCANPDGWEYNRQTNPNGGGQWRKNRKNNGDGSFGVDLNRNWNADWANCSGAIGAPNCGSSDGASDVYWGAAPFSEPETQALKEFIESRDFAACLDQHSVGPYYSLPFGRQARTLTTAQNAVFTQLTSAMGKYNGMRYGNTYQTLGYEVSGAMKDWLLLGGDNGSIPSTYSMTAEGGNGSSVIAFWPLASEIVALCKGMIYQNLQLAYSAGSYIDFQDIGPLNLTTRNGNFSFRVRRTGLGDQPVTVSIIPLNNITSVGAPVTIVSLPNFNDTYTGNISYVLPNNVGNGGNVRFAWRVETGGQVYYDTIRNFYNATTVASDNMEAGSVGTKWTISGGGWNYTTDAAYAGSRSLAESPNNNNYANNATLTAQFKSTLDLRNTGLALLSFYVKHRAENFRDKLQVQASTNGSTWVVVPGRTTVKEPGASDGSTLNGQAALTGISEFWTREVYDLKNFLGSKNVRVRLQFTSNGLSQYAYGTDAGFNIDDLIVYKGASAPAQLMITGNSSSEKNFLRWNPENTEAALAEKFVVERSLNEMDYETLGEIIAQPGNSGYEYADALPYEGENTYRVTAVQGTDKMISSTLSLITPFKTGKIQTGIRQLFPNPAGEKIQVQFYVAEDAADLVIRILNPLGQHLLEVQNRLPQGENQLELETGYLAPGEYILSILQPRTGTQYERKFIRQ